MAGGNAYHVGAEHQGERKDIREGLERVRVLEQPVGRSRNHVVGAGGQAKDARSASQRL